MRGNISWAMLVAAMVAVISCGTAQVDVTAEIEAVRARSDGLLGAEGALDVEGSLAFYAEDAIVQPAGAQQFQGRDANAESYRQFFEESQLKEFSGKRSHVTISHGADLAYEYGVTRTVLAGPEGDLVDIGKYLLVWKKINGEWLVVILTFSSDAPAPVLVSKQ